MARVVFGILVLAAGLAIGYLIWGNAAEPATLPLPVGTDATSALATAVEDLRRQVEQVDDRFDRWELVTAGLGALLALAGFFGYSTLRTWAKRGVESTLNKLAKTEVDARLPVALNSSVEKAEKQILRIAKLLALRASKAFDEALEEFEWTGKVNEIRKESPIFRRAIIDCLFNAKTNQRKNREDAWTAANELLLDDPTIETVRLALKIVVSGRRFDDGVKILENYDTQISQDKDAALYAATLLRRQGKIREALSLAEQFRNPEDFQSLVTLAALKRELGEFTHAHDLLFPAVQRVISYTGDYPQAAWYRVLNTYVANSLDRNRPEDAVQSAYYILRSPHGGVELFTVGRLIQRLNEGHPERTELLAAFKAAIPKLAENEARLKCEVALAEIENRVPEAMLALTNALQQAESGEGGKKRELDAYFYRSHLAQLHLRQGDTTAAIDVVVPAAQLEYGGEAKYWLAAAYAEAGNGDDAARWLKEAMKESPRWAWYARDEPRFRKHPKVGELLAEQTTS